MIIITRPSPYGEELTQLCHQANLPVEHLPFFKIEQGKDIVRLATELNQLKKSDIVIIVSPQVNLMIQSQKSPIYFPKHLHYFAIGQHTAEQFKIVSQQEVRYPRQENSEGFIHYLQTLPLKLAGSNMLILGGDSSREVIKHYFIQQGVAVNHLECYQRTLINYSPSLLMTHRRYDIVVTSVEHLLQLERYVVEKHKKDTRLIVSSERIRKRAIELGWQQLFLVNNANNQNLFKTITALCHNAATT